MRFVQLAGLLALSFATSSFAAEESKPRKPCFIKSSTSGLEFDLHKLAVLPPDDDSKNKDDPPQSWMSKGYDYGVNFTMNFCAPVVEKLEGVQGVEEKLWKNVSAYYEQGGKTYSIGYDR